MTAYILGAGASVSAGYPLASRLLHALSGWLDQSDPSLHYVPRWRNRIVQVRETFGSLDDFETILGKLEDYGHQRVKPTGPTTYHQDHNDIVHDAMQRFRGVDMDGRDGPAQGFYPQYLRSDLIGAFREFFYRIEELRKDPTAYVSFAKHKANSDSSVITFNYDIALERELAKAGNWDIGNGYGFPLFFGRPLSKLIVYKLHGSVNWFKEPVNDAPPPVIFNRDLGLLGYGDLVDPRVGGNGMGVDNSGTFILPDPRKKFRWEQFWAPLWNAAAENLRAANEVFIHGYSMPQTDTRARQLIFENARKAAEINIHCRTTSEKIAEEFRRRGFTNVRSFPSIDFEAWADSD